MSLVCLGVTLLTDDFHVVGKALATTGRISVLTNTLLRLLVHERSKVVLRCTGVLAIGHVWLLEKLHLWHGWLLKFFLAFCEV